LLPITTGKIMHDDMVFYRASRRDCAACALMARCCPKEPARKISRCTYEEARDAARYAGQHRGVRAVVPRPQAH